MIIEKNKRKCNCWRCSKPITLKYKILSSEKFYHLSCYYERFKPEFEVYKNFKKEINKQKYKKIMMLERLE